MIAQAAGLAVLAAISPTGLLIAAIYLGSARPRLTMACYLAGAVAMTVILALLVLFALHSGHLELNRNRTPRYGLRLGLGVLILATVAVLSRRKPKPPDPAKPASGVLGRLVASPGPVSALLVGFVVFGPSLTYVAAIQVIATARAAVPLTAAGVLVVIIIYVALIWLPFVTYLLAPGLTTRYLTTFNEWLRLHGHVILLIALAAAGTYLIINGLLGLLRVT
ncbi:MAG TPA: GAP family protein [Streptosporangiaceae bacterium]